MSDDDDRLERIETKVDALTSSLVGYCAECRSDRLRMQRDLAAHHEMIHGDGNGKRGLDKRVDRLEQSKKQRGWWLALVVTTVLGAVATWVADLFSGWNSKGP